MQLQLGRASSLLSRAWLAGGSGAPSVAPLATLRPAAPRRASLSLRAAARKPARAAPTPPRRGSGSSARPGSGRASKERPLELKPQRQDGSRTAILRGAAALGFGACGLRHAGAACVPAGARNGQKR